jgi:hypothetical protein
MPAKYQVKLYGFTSEDARAFCRDLARVLRTTDEEAWSLLLDAPLVVKDGLDKAQAQRLSETLVSISALCLMEPMDGTAEEEEVPEAPPLVPEATEPEPELVNRALWSFRIWSAIVVVVGVGLLVFGAIAYFVSYRNLSPVKGSGANQSSEVTTQTKAAESGPEAAETRAKLIERIEALQTSLNDSRAKAKELEDEINATAGAMGTDPFELRKKKQTLHAHRIDITNAQKELRSLREQLYQMEGGR